MTRQTFPAALPHGKIEEVFPNIYFVTGTIGMPGPLPMRFSRNMTIVREGERLILVNTVRLSEDGLRDLDALGRVTDVIRIAGFHGMDDPFYKDRYGAKVWAIRGQKYVEGFKQDAATYFDADETMDASTQLPLSGAKLFVFESAKVPEGLLRLEHDGGVVISGDCFQHWHTADRFFNFPAKIMMRVMGFVKPHNIGPGWLAQAKPSPDELRKLLDWPFEHVLPAHGAVVRGNARDKYRPSIERVLRG